MVTYYTDPERVASLLQYSENNTDGTGQVRKNFDTETLPTYQEVEDTINEAEEWIEERAERYWREKTVTNEYHNFISQINRWGSYIDRSGYRVYRIKIKQWSSLKAFDTDEGDKIEIWTGTEWYDFLVSATEGQAMHNGDFWVDLELGNIFLFNRFPQVGDRKIRLTYRVGEATVPAIIRRCTTLLAGAMINERYELYAMANKDSNPSLNQAEKWREMAEKIIEEMRYTSLEVI